MSEIFEQTPAPGAAIDSPGVAAHIDRARGHELRKRLRGLAYGLVISGGTLGYGYGLPDAPGAIVSALVGVVFTIGFLLVVSARFSIHRGTSRTMRRVLREHPWVPVPFTFTRVEHEDGYPMEGIRLLKANGETLLEVGVRWRAEVLQQVRASGVTRVWCAGDPATRAVIALPGGLHAFVYTPDAAPSRALGPTDAGHDPHGGVPAGVDPAGLVLPARRGVRLLRLVAWHGGALIVLALVGGLFGTADEDAAPIRSYLGLPLAYVTVPIIMCFIPLTVPTVRIDGVGITRTSFRGKVSHLDWTQLTEVEWAGGVLRAHLPAAASAPGWHLAAHAGGRRSTQVFQERFGLAKAERTARRAALAAALPYFAWTIAGAQVRIDVGGGSAAAPGPTNR
ncbi:hypothetical protein [Embleya sp. NPDC059259]|uniref:hypothetical protein n=1 Tax=unclassified Embleya TaxID=2699296 RepID=UPI00367E3AE4